MLPNHFLSQAAADACSGFENFLETELPLETMISFVSSAAAGTFDAEETDDVTMFVRAAVWRPAAPSTPCKRVKLTEVDK